jgi:hypothetical protein
MNLNSYPPALEEAFAECIELLQAGSPADAYLQAHPEAASDLAPLLDTVGVLQMWRTFPTRSLQMATVSRQRFLDAARDLIAGHPSPCMMDALAT